MRFVGREAYAEWKDWGKMLTDSASIAQHQQKWDEFEDGSRPKTQTARLSLKILRFKKCRSWQKWKNITKCPTVFTANLRMGRWMQLGKISQVLRMTQTLPSWHGALFKQ